MSLKAESPYLGDVRALECGDLVIQVYVQHPESFTVLLCGYHTVGSCALSKTALGCPPGFSFVSELLSPSTVRRFKVVP